MEVNGYRRDPPNHMISTCRFAVTAVITGAGLLRLHAEKSVVHNCRRCGGVTCYEHGGRYGCIIVGGDQR